MVCHMFAPMDSAASVMPGLASSRDCSISRAINGAMYSVNGTSAAVVPMAVPAIERVNGEMATSRMMNGSDRMMFTATFKMP